MVLYRVVIGHLVFFLALDAIVTHDVLVFSVSLLRGLSAVFFSERQSTMPYSDPKFTVVNPSPTVDDCIKTMRFRDYCVLAGVTAGSWGYGYVFGKPVRMPTASTAATIGLTFAGLVVLQDTRGRLMGYKENAKEVKLYGAHPNQPELRGVQDPRFPTATGRASISTKPPLDWKNYD